MSMTLDERPWLHATFDDAQLAHIRAAMGPLGEQDVETGLVGPADAVVLELVGLVRLVDNPRDRVEYAIPMLRRLADLLEAVGSCWPGRLERLHFAYETVMKVAFKLRSSPGEDWREVAMWAAESQVSLAPRVAAEMQAEHGHEPLPRHAGFKRLAVEADKAGDDHEVMRLCAEAEGQGWAGDWENRRDRALQRACDRIAASFSGRLRLATDADELEVVLADLRQVLVAAGQDPRGGLTPAEQARWPEVVDGRLQHLRVMLAGRPHVN